MLYHLLYSLKSSFSPFNVFGYITFRVFGAILTSLFISFIIGPALIAKLKSLKIDQTIRADGPPMHLSKHGTPTMGGLLILISMTASTLLWARLDNRFIIISLIAMLWLGLLGFLDDYLKLVKKNPKGLPGRYKLAGQLILGLIVAAYLWYFPSNHEYRGVVNIPYLKDVFVNLSYFYIPFVALIIVSSSNGVNLTDGLDGLAIGLLIVSALTFSFFAYFSGHVKIAEYLKLIPVPGSGELTVMLASLIGAGLGFLWFNSYPAKVFMGDTGSLFLGGMLGLTAVFIKQEIILIIIGGVFVFETLSVILQVYSFKKYKKRIFKMAPIHHHFELLGWAEPKVTVRFWIIGLVLALLALASLKIR